MAKLINEQNTKSLSKPINQKMQKSEAQIHKIINDEGKLMIFGGNEKIDKRLCCSTTQKQSNTQ